MIVLFLKHVHRIIYDATSSSDALLSSVLREGNWHWAPARFENLVSIQSKLCLIDLIDEDRLIWIPSKSGLFSCAKTWDVIQRRNPEDSWWFPRPSQSMPSLDG